MRSHRTRTTLIAALATATAVLPSCHVAPTNANDTAVTATRTAHPALPDATPSPTPTGALTTVATDGNPLTRVTARQGVFAIESIDGIDTLTVNGKPASYKEEGANAPEPVSANDGITLEGVYELPDESVAWVLITGGTACAGTHVLLGARSGVALPGQSVPSCDDRGTVRLDGDRLAIQVGRVAGSYRDGVITLTSRPAR